MPAGLLLAIAIAAEVAATVSLRYSEGFSRPLPSPIVVIGYAISFWSLAVLKELRRHDIRDLGGRRHGRDRLIGIVALGEPATATNSARSP